MGLFERDRNGNRFFDMLIQQAARAVEAVRSVEASLDRLDDAAVARIAEIAKVSTELRNVLIDELHKTFITPLDRDHIHQLVNAMDDICDLIQDSTQVMSLYDLKRVTPETARLADIAVKCCERVKDVVELVGKQDGNFEAILRTCEEIDRLESDADRVMRSGMSKLFREEQDVREIIKMKEVYQLLEAVTDRCLDVANLAEGISLENS